MRDVSDPLLWIERYELPTWLDYVRHNQRRTKADDASNAAIDALQAELSERKGQALRVLVKGSRSSAMDKVVSALLANNRGDTGHAA